MIVETVDELRELLSRALTSSECQRILQKIEAGETIQQTISDAAARRLGFQALIH